MASAPKVILKRKSVRPIACGHPWIFSGAIADTNGIDEATDRVVIYDDRGSVVGHGFYSPKSQIRVRLYERTEAPELETLDVDFFYRRLQRAALRRRRLGFPGPKTTGFRLVNSEGDGLPGATVDRWGNLFVFQLTTHFLARNRTLFITALQQIAEDTDSAILEAQAPKAMAHREGFEIKSGWHSSNRPENIEFLENGLRFQISTSNFQKTGHYADMRIHRRWFAEQCVGRRVLDGYSYTGGFGLLAAAYGAESVTCVDTSNSALQALQTNAENNDLSDLVETVESQVDDFLRSAYDRALRFDAITIDPPKLAPRKKHVSKALKVYEALAIQSLRILEPAGLLAIGSCSEAIGSDELERVLGSCCARDGICTDVVYRGSQSPDHPVPSGMTEGRYLTFVVAQVR